MTQDIFDFGETASVKTRYHDIERFDSCGRCLITVDGLSMYDFDIDDTVSSRCVAVMLSTSRLTTQAKVAELWGVDTRTIYVWSRNYAQDGFAGLQPEKQGRPTIITEQLVQQVHAYRANRMKLDEICQQLNITTGVIKTILYARKPTQLELFSRVDDTPSMDTADNEELVEDEADTIIEKEARVKAVDPLDRSLDRAMAVAGFLDDAEPIFADCDHVEGAGALLGIALLSQDPFLDKIKAAYGSIGPAFYGLRTIFTTLILMAFLRIKNPEQNGKRNPLKLGRLLGLDRSPSTRTIRRKIRTLSDHGKALEVMQSLGKARIDEAALPAAILYVDGHVKCYYGKNKIGKTFATSKNTVVKGETDYWLNMADGTPLLCLPSELNDKMSTMLLRIVKDAKKMCGDRRLTVVFDRGGSSAAVYENLLNIGCDFIAYHKNPKKLAESEFTKEETLINGKSCSHAPVSRKIELDVYSRSGKGRYKKTGRTVKVREIVILRDTDGGQTSVVTSRSDLTAVHVLEAIFARWTQENYFKYLLEEYAFDHLLVYGSESLQKEHNRPNPEYEKLRRKISKLRSKIAGKLGVPLEHLAEILVEEQSKGSHNLALTKKNKKALQDHLNAVTAMKEKMSKLPERISTEDFCRLPQESRLVSNLVKMTAYTIEGKLAGILKNLHNGKNGNERGLCSGFLQSTGALLVEDGRLHVALEKQGDPTRNRLLSALCDQLNALESIYPGSSLRMFFSVKNQ